MVRCEENMTTKKNGRHLKNYNSFYHCLNLLTTYSIALTEANLETVDFLGKHRSHPCIKPEPSENHQPHLQIKLNDSLLQEYY